MFVKLAVPNIMTNAMYMLGFTVAFMFAGHLEDASNLAVMGLVQTVMNIIVMSIMVGVNSAQETLTS